MYISKQQASFPWVPMQEAEKELECWIYRHPGSEMEPAAKGKVTIANTNDKEGDLNLSLR